MTAKEMKNKIAVGQFHCLGLKSNGSIMSWGWNEDKQCEVPGSNMDFVAVAVGQTYSLALCFLSLYGTGDA